MATKNDQIKNKFVLKPTVISENNLVGLSYDWADKIFDNISTDPTDPTTIYDQTTVDELKNHFARGVNGSQPPNDVIEFHVYDDTGTLLYSDHDLIPGVDFNSLIDSATGGFLINLDLPNHLKNSGFTAGSYQVKYKFYRKFVGQHPPHQTEDTTSEYNQLFIDEISPSRTEIRVLPIKNGNSNFMDMMSKYNLLATDSFDGGFPATFESNGVKYRVELIGNLGMGKSVTITNWFRDEVTYGPDSPAILFRLREELEGNIATQEPITIGLQLAEDVVYKVELIPEDTSPDKIIVLGPPNTSVGIDAHATNNTTYLSWNDLVTTNNDMSRRLLNAIFSGSLNEIEPNIDFRSFENFVHFGSAEDRLRNFKWKIQQIEAFDTNIEILQSAVSQSVTSSYQYTSSIQTYYDKKYNMIGTFDAYERYLYEQSSSYESSSYGEFYPTTWPKQNPDKPYVLYAASSSQVETWFDGIISSASLYDKNNLASLVRSIPSWIREEGLSVDYETFTNMIGHFYDNIKVYLDTYLWYQNQSESPSEGLAKDLIYHTIQSLGFETNSDLRFEDLWQYVLGTDSTGSYDNIDGTGGLNVVTSSMQSSKYDNQIDIWKRILNNIPYIYKTRGTDLGVQSILNCFGIPEEVLSAEEFHTASDLEILINQMVLDARSLNLDDATTRADIRSRFITIFTNLGFSTADATTTADNILIDSEFDANRTDVRRFYELDFYNSRAEAPFGEVEGTFPTTTEFGFRIDTDGVSNVSKSMMALMHVSNSATGFFPDPYYVIGTNWVSGSWGTIGLYVNESGLYVSGSTIGNIAIESEPLPIYDGDWWNVMYRLEPAGAAGFSASLHIANADQGRIQFTGSAAYASSSIDYVWNHWFDSDSSRVFGGGKDFVLRARTEHFYPLSGSMREIRYWNLPLYERDFNQHVINPISYASTNYSSSYIDFVSRYPLGTDLTSYNHNVTQSIASKHPNTNLTHFDDGTAMSMSFYNFPDKNNYTAYRRKTYTIVPLALSQRPTSAEARIQVDPIVRNERLHRDVSSKLSIENTDDNRNMRVDIAFKPNKPFNEDIDHQFGSSLELASYIGDPADMYRTEYTLLNDIRQTYFSKFTRTYNLSDFLRMTEFFDKGLFTTLVKTLPARVIPLTGVTIEPHILNRPKIRLMTGPPTMKQPYYEETIDLNISTEMSGSVHYQTGDMQFTASVEGDSDLVWGGSTNAFEGYELEGLPTTSGDYLSQYSGSMPGTASWDLSNAPSTALPSTVGNTSTNFGTLVAIMGTNTNTTSSAVYAYTQLLRSGSTYYEYTPDFRDWNSSAKAIQTNFSSSRKLGTDEYLTYNEQYSGSILSRSYYEAQYQGPYHISIENLFYNGCKVSSADINVPTLQTPDGGPVVAVILTDPNTITAERSDNDNSDLTIT